MNRVVFGIRFSPRSSGWCGTGCSFSPKGCNPSVVTGHGLVSADDYSFGCGAALCKGIMMNDCEDRGGCGVFALWSISKKSGKIGLRAVNFGVADGVSRGRLGAERAWACRGFSLIEAAVLVAGVGLLAMLVLPSLGVLRTEARLAGSRDNLRQLGEAHAAYSDANSGFIAGYDWVGFESSGFGGPPPPEYDLGGGVTRQALDNREASELQLAAILRKATGRIGVENNVSLDDNHPPYRRYWHMPLIDFMGGSVTDPMVVSPLDAHQQDFQKLTQISEYPELPGGTPFSPGTWQSHQTVLKWAYASSYHMTAYAYSPSRPLDNSLALWPFEDATQFSRIRTQQLERQLRSSVSFPSNKALLFEEFDYSHGLGNQGRYYADPLASVNVLAFDGSAQRIATADANPGWDPRNYTDMNKTVEQRYRSIDTRFFPDDSDRPEPYAGFYEWTRGGLEGIDFGAGEINTSDW